MLFKFAGDEIFQNSLAKSLLLENVCLGVKIHSLFLQREGKVNLHFPFLEGLLLNKNRQKLLIF